MGLAAGLEKLIRECASRSLWPLSLGFDYGTLELCSAFGPHYDIARLGAEVMRPSPRQTDLLIVSGVVTRKMAPVLRELFAAMAEPKFVMALGSPAISGTPFNGSYSLAGDISALLPVDLYVPGDPPPPAAILDSIELLGAAIRDGSASGSRTLGKYEPGRWPYLGSAMVYGNTWPEEAGG